MALQRSASISSEGNKREFLLKLPRTTGRLVLASHCMVSHQGNDAPLRERSRPVSRPADIKGQVIIAVAFNSNASLISAIVRLLSRQLWRPQNTSDLSVTALP
jgi:hypothetical protein